MSDQLQMFFLETSEDTPSATSSPELASGPTLCASPDGLTAAPPGPDLALASLSPRQAGAAGLLTSGTSGRISTISPDASALKSCLESRFRARLASAGGTLYRLTWKRRTTPRGQSILAQRASARRSSDSDCTGWPSPRAREAGPDYAITDRPESGGYSLETAAALAGWCAPMAMDGNRGGLEARPWDTGIPLSQQAALAGWAAPAERDYRFANARSYSERGGGAKGEQLNNQVVHLQPGPMRRLASGEILTGSTAGMDAGGQLRPGHPRWLMALPPAWDDSAVTAMQSMSKQRKRSSKS